MLVENSELSHGRESEEVSENITMLLREEHIQAANNLMSDVVSYNSEKKKNQHINIWTNNSHYTFIFI